MLAPFLLPILGITSEHCWVSNTIAVGRGDTLSVCDLLLLLLLLITFITETNECYNNEITVITETHECYNNVITETHECYNNEITFITETHECYNNEITFITETNEFLSIKLMNNFKLVDFVSLENYYKQ